MDNKLQDAISRSGIVFGELYPVLHSGPEVTHILLKRAASAFRRARAD